MALLAALCLALLGLLPVANWITGGHQAPWYDERLRLWAIGLGVVGIITLGVGIALRRRPQLWNADAWTRTAGRWQQGGRRADAVIALIAGLLYAAVARIIFSARPLLIDEIIQLYQARIFASGRLFLPSPALPEFTSAMNLIDWGGKVYGQFPPGGPAILAIGTLLRVEWLVGPAMAALTVFLLARLLRRIEPGAGVALAALLLFAFAPFTFFLSGSMMNHVPTLTCLVGGAYCLAQITRKPVEARLAAPPESREEGGPWYAAAPQAGLLLGIALGVGATIRPLDAAAFALPAGAWLFALALRGGRAERLTLLLSGVGLSLPLLFLFWVNTMQGGSSLQFGYLTMWGKSHELGFHETPWGDPHTPLRGLELINLYLLRLQTWMFETPLPSLLFATVALAMTRVLSSFDRYLVAASGIFLLAYFAYWHDGFYLGPRFIFPLAPWIALWTARLPGTLAARGLSLEVRRLTITSGIVSLLLGGLVLLPLRWEQYQQGMAATRFDGDAIAAQAKVRNAVVLVRESWGAQLYARLWALGVTRIEAHQIYSRMDSCQLDRLLTRAEASGASPEQFLALARPAAAATHRLVRVRTAADSAIHLVAGASVAPHCVRRIQENQSGFTTFPPLLLAGREGNRFVRELHGRDSLLLREHPGRPVYLLLRDTTSRSPLRLVPVSLDSARAEWRATADEPK